MPAPDFSQTTKNILAQHSAFICNNPDCRRLCIAPEKTDDSKLTKIYEAAHICDARKKTQRYDSTMTNEQRADLTNGILLCASCHTMIDKNDGNDYSVSLLKSWKASHKDWLKENLNKRLAGSDGDESRSLVTNMEIHDNSDVLVESSAKTATVAHIKVSGRSSLHVKSKG